MDLPSGDQAGPFWTLVPSGFMGSGDTRLVLPSFTDTNRKEFRPSLNRVEKLLKAISAKVLPSADQATLPGTWTPLWTSRTAPVAGSTRCSTPGPHLFI